MTVDEAIRITKLAKSKGLCVACDFSIDDHEDREERCHCCNLRCPSYVSNEVN